MLFLIRRDVPLPKPSRQVLVVLCAGGPLRPDIRRYRRYHFAHQLYASGQWTTQPSDIRALGASDPPPRWFVLWGDTHRLKGCFLQSDNVICLPLVTFMSTELASAKKVSLGSTSPFPITEDHVTT